MTQARDTSEVAWRADITLGLGDFKLELDIELGASAAVIGANASGKSSLLRVLCGALRPDRGRVHLGGQTVFDASAGVDLAASARSVGWVPQSNSLFEHLDVLDNVAFALRVGPRPLPREAARAQARARLEALDLSGLAHRSVRSLSGGEMQRVVLLRALVGAPKLLLLDEAFASLDAITRRRTRAWLREVLAESELDVLLVTHDARDLSLFADPAATPTLVLAQGRALACSAARELRREPPSSFVREFFSLDELAFD